MKYLFPFLLMLITSCGKMKIPAPESKVKISKMTLHTSLTITNNTNSTVDLSNWQLKEVVDYITVSTRTFTITGKTLTKGESITFSATTLGFSLNFMYTSIYLYDNAGNLIDDY